MTALLAHIAVRRSRAVIAGWLLTAAACALVATGLLGELSNSGLVVRGSDSARAADVLAQHFPGHDGAQLLAAVTVRDPSASERWNNESIRLVRKALGGRPEVRSLTPNGTAIRYGSGNQPTNAVTLVGVQLRIGQARAEADVPALRAALSHANRPRIDARLLGPPVVEQRYAAIASADLTRAEELALPLTLLVLLVAFQAPMAALLPVLLAVVTMLVTFACLAVIGRWIGISVFVTNTATILALGLSVDFSLFMVTRYREELARCGSVEQALTTTITTTGRAVLLSSCTIATSLVALFVVGVATFSTMAIGAGIATLVAAAAALSLLPATIQLAGHRVEWQRIDRVARAAARATLWSRLARAVTDRPVATLLASLAVLVALALPARSFGLDVHTQRLLPRDDHVRRDIAFVAHVMYPGVATPVLVVTREPFSRAVRRIERDRDFAQMVSATKGTGGWSALQAVLQETPDGPAAQRAVERLRAQLQHDRGARETHVGGIIAGSIDLTERISQRAPWAILVATALCFAALAWGLHSLVIPLKAVLTTLLSVAATLGLLLRLFHGSGPVPHLEFFVPLFLFAILFGLSVDYEVFLLSRIREAAAAGHDHREAVRRGLVGSARSITLAGLTLTTVFLAFATSRLLPFQQLGVGLALAVALDITLVRCLLVPAAVVLLRRWNWWWPGRRFPEAGDPGAGGTGWSRPSRRASRGR